ncbi:UBP26 isoform X2 [Zea mays]|uniref:Ubiquitin carboxyl-terminal hydrolase 26 n=1 Tax=Zea mays TaxID=4577 RepID=A0A096SLC8_MAIZE|nr:UBP26 isoform X2 [Zea mays]ONM54363.1 UBP26 [Zea mays]ONM54366.1 UBP26 [Zea mays]ONM54369.1 UBP26 [Zea mays]ONM54372.1 UBP26 [Zea mays]ONM54375.1 UBP26 [Zea mays]|eukprot:XP_020396159.1 UBP26 isoform X2 [Zea mays]
MSRPNTRNKSKRPRSDESINPSAAVFKKIHSAGDISKDDICQLYMVWKPPCHGCHGNTKDSPNCFCGLIPAANGVRKTGLWQKMQEMVRGLGPNPSKDLRDSTDTPAGLTNLGATCYANSILQCLYMNIAFRSGIFSLELDVLEKHPVLDQLARLFAQLHSSKMLFIDSAPFIKTLELDNGVQQDSHEFLTLFLSLLEQSLSHSKVPGARTIVQNLFCGSVSHVTRCSSCGKESAASSKMEDFYELELNIKGLNNLEESLNEYFSEEALDGENQYFCESCQKRVDATRCIKLRSLPPVVNFQLKRYVFLPKTTTKKKISSTFSFPGQLDLGKRLSEPSSSCTYALSAILIHKGTGANSGHYVAHIKDESNGQWWEFDDETVSKLGLHPFGEKPGKASNKDDQKSQNTSTEGSVTNNNNNGHHEAAPSSTMGEMFSSTDAYMLMYKCITKDVNPTESNKIVEINNDLLPHHLLDEINELNASYTKLCVEYQSKKDSHLAYITERRQEVKSVLTEAPAGPGDDSYFWISTDWLRQWADNITPPSSIDNGAIQCEHGKVPASKVTSMKRLSSVAWQKLHSKYGGGPILNSDDFCMECLKDGAKSAVSADVYRERRASLKTLAEAALAGNCPDGPSYFISKTWLTHWLRRKNADIPSDGDNGPTSALRCCHGDFLPEHAPGAKRVSVPEILWLFLYQTVHEKKADDTVTFPSDSHPCETCSRELSDVASVEVNLRAVKLKQRQNHEKLISGKSFALHPGQKYYLVPSSWLSEWRAYITATGKNISSLPEPQTLEAVARSLICEKHSRLLQRPLDLVLKRGSIIQKASNTDGLTIIPEYDWKLFSEEWSATPGKGISAEIAFSKSSQDKLHGSSEAVPITDGNLGQSLDDTNDDLGAREPYIRTDPEVCEECIGERESCALVEKLNYQNEDIHVYFVHGKEAPKSIKEASKAVTVPDRRTSKRSRRTSSGNSISLKVSGSTSVYQLKLMIWESLGIVKENQMLHKGSVEIEDDFATLADKSIFPGDFLWVRDSEIYENRDIADEISEQKDDMLQAEEGFRGTLLTSTVSAQLCQDIAFSE